MSSCDVVGLSILVIVVVALFICVITLGTGLAYMHRCSRIISDILYTVFVLDANTRRLVTSC